MSNLLPEKAQQKIHSEYRERFILAGSSLAIGAAVFSALTLFPSFGVLFISRPAELAKANQVQQGKQDNTDISRAQSLVVQLAPIAAASSSVTSAIAEALAERPSGVHVDNVIYNTGVPATITIGGVGDSRTNIDKYRTTLQADLLFSSVNLPVDDLVGTQGGRFTITLSGHF